MQIFSLQSCLGIAGNTSIVWESLVPLEGEHCAAQLPLRHHPRPLQDGLGRHPGQRQARLRREFSKDSR